MSEFAPFSDYSEEELDKLARLADILGRHAESMQATGLLDRVQRVEVAAIVGNKSLCYASSQDMAHVLKRLGGEEQLNVNPGNYSVGHKIVGNKEYFSVIREGIHEVRVGMGMIDEQTSAIKVLPALGFIIDDVTSVRYMVNELHEVRAEGHIPEHIQGI